MLEAGLAHALVTGAVHSTGDMLRPALQILGTAPGNKTVSSMFLMVMPDGKLLGFGDCAVIPDPTVDQLSDIAIATAKTFKTLTSIEPAVAMLSFSTKGSAEHDMVTKVREATALAHQKASDLLLDGELQFDAAYVPSVGERKAPGSPVAGKANVFIFPELNAGNIGYKLVQRLAGAQAIGPISHGPCQTSQRPVPWLLGRGHPGRLLYRPAQRVVPWSSLYDIEIRGAAVCCPFRDSGGMHGTEEAHHLHSRSRIIQKAVAAILDLFHHRGVHHWGRLCHDPHDEALPCRAVPLDQGRGVL